MTPVIGNEIYTAGDVCLMQITLVLPQFHCDICHPVTDRQTDGRYKTWPNDCTDVICNCVSVRDRLVCGRAAVIGCPRALINHGTNAEAADDAHC